MKISTKGRYGLRAVLDIANNSNDGKFVSIHDIADRQDISAGYLERIISKLKKAEIVRSERGAQGGYVLARDAKDITSYDVLSVLETNINVSECAVDAENCVCSDKTMDCTTRKLWCKINNAATKILKETTIEELMMG